MAWIFGDEKDNNLEGTSSSDVLQGMAGNDLLQGEAGNDELYGDDGDDILLGGPGHNTLNGGAGTDFYVLDSPPNFATFSDPISGQVYVYEDNLNTATLDFVAGEDQIILLQDLNLYTSIPSGVLADSMLRVGPGLTSAADADDFLIYDSTAGMLYYDADASGPTKAVEIATLYNAAQLSASDIQVVAWNRPTSTAGNDHLVGSAGPDVLAGGDGNDILQGGGLIDNLAGGRGLDIAVYAGPRADYQLANNTNIPWSNHIVDNNAANGNEGIDSLSLIERLRFSDMSVALDVTTVNGMPYWDSNAGEVAKIIGAVYGKEMVQDLYLAGLGLYHRDQLDSYEALMRLALNDKLGANASNRQVVDLLYTNVIGTAPSDSDAQIFVDMLNNGTHTQASLAVFAADTAENATNIDLAGLRTTGLSYYEYGHEYL